MLPTLILIIALSQTMANSFPGHEAGLTDALLREMVAKMGNDLVDPGHDYLDLPVRRMPFDGISPRSMGPGPLDYEDMALSPSLRDREYLAHSSLLGTMLGSYEPTDKELQRLKPVPAESKITSELKSEGALPAYCNPPNPCPIGYTADDGCLEEFENTAGYSRDYQAMQECMCDTEHMFQCPDSTRESEITALARSIQNEGAMDSTLDKIMAHLKVPSADRLISKKYHIEQQPNPFLRGEKLPIAAKKGSI